MVTEKMKAALKYCLYEYRENVVIGHHRGRRDKWGGETDIPTYGSGVFLMKLHGNTWYEEYKMGITAEEAERQGYAPRSEADRLVNEAYALAADEVQWRLVISVKGKVRRGNRVIFEAEGPFSKIVEEGKVTVKGTYLGGDFYRYCTVEITTKHKFRSGGKFRDHGAHLCIPRVYAGSTQVIQSIIDELRPTKLMDRDQVKEVLGVE